MGISSPFGTLAAGSELPCRAPRPTMEGLSDALGHSQRRAHLLCTLTLTMGKGDESPLPLQNLLQLPGLGCLKAYRETRSGFLCK